MRSLSLLLALALPCFATEKPNVILILADDLGYGDLGCYGQQLIQTPYLDRMASEGMRFTQFYAGSTVCAPSRAVLMTGRHTGHVSARQRGREELDDRAVPAAALRETTRAVAPAQANDRAHRQVGPRRTRLRRRTDAQRLRISLAT